MNNWKIRLASAVSLCSSMSLVAVAQEEITPTAKSVLETAATFYESLAAFSGRAVATTTVDIAENSIEIEQLCTFALASPDKFTATHSDMEGQAFKFVCDGERQIQYHDFINTYIERNGKASFLEIVAQGVFDHKPTLDLVATMPHLLVLILSSGPSSYEYLSAMGTITHLGVEDVNNQKADHLLIDGEHVDADIWIARDDDPWLLQVSIDLTSIMKLADASKPLQAPKTEMRVRFEQWQVEEEILPKLFRFNPPRGSTSVDSVDAFLEKQRANLGEEGGDGEGDEDRDR